MMKVGSITMEMSPMSASRWWRKDEVGAEPEAEDLKGVRGGGVLVDDMVKLRLAKATAKPRFSSFGWLQTRRNWSYSGM